MYVARYLVHNRKPFAYVSMSMLRFRIYRRHFEFKPVCIETIITTTTSTSTSTSIRIKEQMTHRKNEALCINVQHYTIYGEHHLIIIWMPLKWYGDTVFDPKRLENWDIRFVLYLLFGCFRWRWQWHLCISTHSSNDNDNNNNNDLWTHCMCVRFRYSNSIELNGFSSFTNRERERHTLNGLMLMHIGAVWAYTRAHKQLRTKHKN